MDKLTSTVLYKDVYENVDLEYVVLPTGLKENIILKSDAAQMVFEAEYKSNGLIPEQLDEKTIVLKSDDGENIYTICAPFMEDSGGVYCENVSLTLENIKSNSFSVIISLDKDWLLQEERKYPVLVDPVLKTNQDISAANSAFVSSANPNKCYLASGTDEMGSLYVGNISGFGQTESYIKFTSLPTLGIADKVIDARVYLALRKCEIGLTVNIKQLTSDWDPYTVKWNNKPTSNSIIKDYMALTPQTDTSQFQSVEITDLVRGWYSGEYPNYGISLSTDKTTASKAWFYSIHYTGYTAARPIMTVTYRNMSGYEEYWSYTNLEGGRNGVISINNYNGNLVFAQPLTSDNGGNLMPVNLSLIYNSNGISTQFAGNNTANYSYMASKMQTNYHMYVREDSSTSTNGYRYFFHDGDGTRHWFYFDNASETSGKDEDGLGYTLDLIAVNSDSTCAAARYRIKDKNNTRFYFNSLGNLIQITNANNVSATVQYETVSGYLRIKSITDGVGRVYTFNYHPNYAYLVYSITDPASKNTAFEYWNGFLTQVKFPDNNYYNITYSGGVPVSFGSINGTKTTVSYDSSSQKRVTAINWGTNSNDFLEQYTFSYRQNETTVTDKQGRSYTYQFNDYAQTTGIISNIDGTAQFFEWESGNSTKKTANKLISQSKAIKTVTNYVVNPSFYKSYSNGYWTYAPDSTGSPTVSIDTTKGNLTKSSLKVYKPSNNTKNVMAVQNVVGVTAGTYTISAYINTNGTTLGGEGAYFGVEFRNSSGTLTTVQGSERIKKTDSWERVSLTFTLPETHTLTFVAGFDCFGNNSYGTVWFDDIQLEKGTGVSSFNLIENSGMNNGKTGWPDSTYLNNANLSGFDKATYRAGDVTNQWLGISQHIYSVSGNKGDVFSFGSWVKVASAPVDNETKTADSYKPNCRLVLHFYDNNGKWNSEKKIEVNTDITTWQFLSGEAIAPIDYSRVCLELIYFHNVNTFGMVGAFCYKEEFGQTYTYDENGNVVSSVDVSNSESTFSYKNNQLTQMLNPSGSKFFYSFAYNESDLAEAVSTDGQQYSFTYDTSGNMLTATVEKDKPVTNFQTGVAYIIRNVKTGNVLDRGYVNKSAYNWRYRKGNLYQQWKLEATGEADVYYLKCCAPWDNEKYLYVKDSANTDNADLKVSVSADSDAHKFKLHANGDGTFRILTKASNYTKCLDSLPGSSIDTGDGSNLKQYTRISEDKAQHWLFYPDITGSNPVDATAEKIITSAQYTDDKNFLSSVSDAAGNETYYNYESNTGNLLSTTDAKGNITSYTYDQYTDNLLSVAAGETVNSYTYSKDRLDKISTTDGTSYKFIYDGFGRTTAIQRGNGTAYSILSSMEYNSAGLLSKQTYGNGNYVNFYYDSLDRLTEKVYNGNSSKKIVYYYGSDGRVSYCMDYIANTTTRYVYDLAGRVIKLKVYNCTTFRCLELKESVTYNYADKTNYVTSVTYTSPLGTQTVNYGYGSLATETMPDTVYTVYQNGTEQIKYSFDDLARLSSRTISPINKTQTYTYRQGGHGTNSTTTQVASVTADGVTTSYTYDAVGNITAINKNNELYESYEYDALSQLTKVTTASGDVYEYTYSGGNITSVKLNGTPLKTYSYDNNEWADLLTGYNGDTITYENIGNPLNYRDGMTFNWQNGRQLAGITKGTDSIAYTYNADGLRTSKTINGTTTEYTYIDGRLIGEKTGNNTIVYLYDENGSKYGFTYNGVSYYYELNLQGDVVGIYDSTGTTVVTYAYDVWGKVLSVTGTLASTIGQINPIRYRGYYYDNETGFYFLQSRYYDPETGRFLNADGYVSTG